MQFEKSISTKHPAEIFLSIFFFLEMFPISHWKCWYQLGLIGEQEPEGKRTSDFVRRRRKHFIPSTAVLYGCFLGASIDELNCLQSVEFFVHAEVRSCIIIAFHRKPQNLLVHLRCGSLNILSLLISGIRTSFDDGMCWIINKSYRSLTYLISIPKNTYCSFS